MYIFFNQLWKRLHHAVDKANKPQQSQKSIEQNNKRIEELQQSLEKIIKMIYTLTNSDKDTIKPFIIREHHYFC